MFETTDSIPSPYVHTFIISMFGASYLAGATIQDIGMKSLLVLLAPESDPEISLSYDGFSAGVIAAGERSRT